ncbi:hypothetical protein AVEN_45635-1 [Araneus ventricosus]|uniref:Uncharacterized protein n=1 Tax=Araneus ventricosus TaxID=182803 RepID=A0A4Y2EUW7_ARAVE|nr:hypothetical protein AVEN_45635-1 [Araneus ventricosus]
MGNVCARTVGGRMGNVWKCENCWWREWEMRVKCWWLKCMEVRVKCWWLKWEIFVFVENCVVVDVAGIVKTRKCEVKMSWAGSATSDKISVCCTLKKILRMSVSEENIPVVV